MTLFIMLQKIPVLLKNKQQDNQLGKCNVLPSQFIQHCRYEIALRHGAYNWKICRTQTELRDFDRAIREAWLKIRVKQIKLALIFYILNLSLFIDAGLLITDLTKGMIVDRR